jgi:hypothetical protein
MDTGPPNPSSSWLFVLSLPSRSASASSLATSAAIQRAAGERAPRHNARSLTRGVWSSTAVWWRGEGEISGKQRNQSGSSRTRVPMAAARSETRSACVCQHDAMRCQLRAPRTKCLVSTADLRIALTAVRHRGRLTTACQHPPALVLSQDTGRERGTSSAMALYCACASGDLLKATALFVPMSPVNAPAGRRNSASEPART